VAASAPAGDEVRPDDTVVQVRSCNEGVSSQGPTIMSIHEAIEPNSLVLLTLEWLV
jgi:hypothetical protein